MGRLPKVRFSLRRFVLLTVAVGTVLGLCGMTYRSWSEREESNQQAFIARFERSFRSGRVALVGKPEIIEYQRVLMKESRYRQIRPLRMNEYRIVSQIETAGARKWAAWSYAANAQGNDGIFQFSYAEASTREQLPEFPSPRMGYVQWADTMVDGIPVTAGPSATIVSLPAQVKAGEPVTLIASTPPGTICELQTFPADLGGGPFTPETPDAKGNVTWTWQPNPCMAGYNMRVIVKCIQPLGSERLANETEAPHVQILAE